MSVQSSNEWYGGESVSFSEIQVPLPEKGDRNAYLMGLTARSKDRMYTADKNYVCLHCLPAGPRPTVRGP